MVLNWLGLRRSKASKSGDNDPVVFRFGRDDLLRWKSLEAGVLVVGGTGSGKSTSSLSHLFMELAELPVFRKGFKTKTGFLCFTVKQSEADRIEMLCRKVGRDNDVIRVKPGSGIGLDPVRYEMNSPGGSPESAASMLKWLVSIDQKGTDSDPFWPAFAYRIMHTALILLHLANRSATLRSLKQFIHGLPNGPEQVKSIEWEKGFVADTIRTAEQNIRSDGDLDDFTNALDQITISWPNTPSKTRGSVLPIIENILGKLLTGPVGELTRHHDPIPEWVASGKIVLLDYPLLTFREPARYAQILIKVLFDRFILRRPPNTGNYVVRWCDEGANFLVPDHDVLTQSVAREHRLISVLAIQDLQTARSLIGGGDRATQQLDGILANHALKVLHANTCQVTNQSFADLIGLRREMLFGCSSQPEAYDPVEQLLGQAKPTSSTSFNEAYHHDLKPSRFLNLAKGGPPDFAADAILIHGGQRFSNGKPWMQVRYPQVLS